MSAPLVHVSLFSGVGMFDLAMERAGIPTIAACEIDKPARGVISHHWPDLHIFTDVREVTADALRDLGADPDRTVLTAGWPCQGNSMAGRRHGLSDERSGLWGEVSRLLGEFRPAWFVGENVPGLLSVNDGRDFGQVLDDLGECGYGVAWRILDAQHFGVPQRRRRLAIVGNRGDNGAAPAQVLLEPEGVPGNPAAGITPRQVAPRRIGSGPAVCSLAGPGLAPTLTAQGLTDHLTGGVPMITTVSGEIAHTLTAEGSDASEDGTGRGTPIIAAPAIASTLTAGSSGVGVSAPGRRQEDNYNLVGYIAETANTLTAGGGERGYRIDAESAAGGQLVAFHENQRGELREPADAGALSVGGGKPGQGYPAVRQFIPERDTTNGKPKTGPDKALRLLRESVDEEEIAEWCAGIAASLLPEEVLQQDVHGRGLRQETSEGRSIVGDSPLPRTQGSSGRAVRTVWQDGRERRAPHQWQLERQLARELDTYLSELPPTDTHGWQEVHDLWRATQRLGLLREALPKVQEDRRPHGNTDANTEDVHSLRGTRALAFTLRHALHAGKARGVFASDLKGGAGVMVVRRLTPRLRECERLQGLPDNWTAISDGKPQSDSRRYHQIGNGLAVPVFEWIARRIAAMNNAQENAA